MENINDDRNLNREEKWGKNVLKIIYLLFSIVLNTGIDTDIL